MQTFLNFFRSSLRRQILAAIGLIAFLTFNLSILTLLELRQIQPLSQTIAQTTGYQKYSRDIITQVTVLDTQLEQYILIPSVEQREHILEQMQALEQSILGLGEAYDPEVAPIQASMASLYYMQLKPQVDTLLNDPSLSSGEINRLSIQIFTSLDALQQSQQTLSELLVGRIRQSATKQAQIAGRVRIETIVASAVIGFLILGVFLILQTSLRQVVHLTDTAAALQQGDLSARAHIQAQNEIGVLANTLNTMAENLQSLVASLEQRVNERTKALQTLLEISRRLSAATDPKQLALEVVEQLQNAFGYYHAQIYYVDEASGDLIMSGGTGEAGAAMLAAGHTIHKGQGLVGRAAETKAPVLVSDVSKAIGWLPNPLLPETQSEAAVPILQGDRVLGVLDVQQNRVGALTERDVTLLQSIAAQVAISLRNARTYAESAARAELEAAINYITQRVQQASTIEETLQTALRESGMILGAKRMAVRLNLPSTRG